jgi:hypothetical protein
MDKVKREGSFLGFVFGSDAVEETVADGLLDGEAFIGVECEYAIEKLV